MTPLPAFTRYGPGTTPLAVNHQSEFVASTISFNLAPGKSLSDAAAAFQRATQKIRLPADIIGGFAGTALEYEKSLSAEQLLVAAAIVAIYIVLGIFTKASSIRSRFFRRCPRPGSARSPRFSCSASRSRSSR